MSEKTTFNDYNEVKLTGSAYILHAVTTIKVLSYHKLSPSLLVTRIVSERVNYLARL